MTDYAKRVLELIEENREVRKLADYYREEVEFEKKRHEIKYKKLFDQYEDLIYENGKMRNYINLHLDQDPKVKLKLAYSLLKEIEDDDSFRGLEQAELGEIAYRLGFKFNLDDE